MSSIQARRRRRQPLSPEQARLAETPWPVVYDYLARNWKQGEHASLIGPNGAGKTHLALMLGELRGHTIVLATKRRDPLVQDLTRRGYVLVTSLDEVPLAADNGRPVHKRVLLWVNPDTRDERQRRRIQSRRLADALSGAERQGSWCVIVDETIWLSDSLGLKQELDSLWYQARSSKVSVVACAQRPTTVPRMMVSQATHVFIWAVSDRRELETLRDLGGNVPREVLEENIATLDWDRHEFLYVNTRTNELMRSVAPPR